MLELCTLQTVHLFNLHMCTHVSVADWSMAIAGNNIAGPDTVTASNQIQTGWVGMSGEYSYLAADFAVKPSQKASPQGPRGENDMCMNFVP